MGIDPLKQELYNHCQDYIQNRLGRIQKNIQEIQEALGSETKSSAGDKHETGRAMIQLERENLGVQLSEIQKVQELFKRVPLTGRSKTASLGSLVITNISRYYLAVSAGEVFINGEAYYAISPNTPIGKLVLGKTENEIMVFNGKEILIKEII
ncbi:3-oxoacyl-ACP synthase [Sediminicola arcticus]|jgi:transcription elongation GreA/GreB family factor|uniref:3-oxoacyl-ACP synthase n=1 Tax=Sediminicola arcticus TaxID=1574308 RepID=A0ABV2SQL4_9FLAO